jgi:hypothetical protein
MEFVSQLSDRITQPAFGPVVSIGAGVRQDFGRGLRAIFQGLHHASGRQRFVRTHAFQVAFIQLADASLVRFDLFQSLPKIFFRDHVQHSTPRPYFSNMKKKKAAKKKADSRVFGQDLMKGENKKFGKMVGGTRPDFAGPDYAGGPAYAGTGTSIFDPVLCEIAYRWFCPPEGIVLDPFAGGSVRGLVASRLGRHYVGIDLREEQLAENRKQAHTIARPSAMPEWITGDSRHVLKLLGGRSIDFLFSCPPYSDLEVYSDDPQDLSTLDYRKFRKDYAAIIKACCGLLKPNRFACFIVGDLRDRKGMYRGFPWHTVEAFQLAGLHLYNEAVLVTAVGSLPIRVTKQFQSMRKLGKTHQNVLVFVKGDPRKAVEAIGEVELATLEELYAGANG